MILQFNRGPAQLRGVRARIQKLLQILQTTLARRLNLVRSFIQRTRGGFEFICIFKLTRQLLRALHVKFVHLAPAVFELGKIRGIQVQLRRHLHLAETKAFSRGHQKFAFVKIS